LLHIDIAEQTGNHEQILTGALAVELNRPAAGVEGRQNTMSQLDSDEILAMKRRYFPIVLAIAGGGDILIGGFFALFGPALLGGGDTFLEGALILVGVIMIIVGAGLLLWARRRAQSNQDNHGAVIRRQ